MEDTRTRFCAAIPASRSASSNEVRRSLCLPTPFVRKMRLGTRLSPNDLSSEYRGKMDVNKKITHAGGLRGEIQTNFSMAGNPVAQGQPGRQAGKGLRRWKLVF